jgi:hypothetical protein
MRRLMFLGVLAVTALGTAPGCGGGGGDPDAPTDVIDAEPLPPDATERTCPNPTGVGTSTTAELDLEGDVGSTRGVFDPSVVYPAGAPGGAMAYSSVPNQHAIRTRIALSPDAGATWTFVAEANTPEAAIVTTTDLAACPGGTCIGSMISEVTSLIIDPDDPDANRRWKLFAHRYLAEDDDTLHYRFGTITLQTAPAPEGPWTEPVKLLGWDSPSNVSSDGVAQNVSDLPETADCLLLTEPGALWRDAAGGSVIDLALGCVYLDGTSPLIRVVLLRSDDHAASWEFVSNLVYGEDVLCLENDPLAQANAAELFVSGGEQYVMVATAHAGQVYSGCMVFPVDDPDAGEIRRDAQGRSVPVRSLVPQPARFAGACAYAEGATAMGYAMSVGFLDTARPFRIVASEIDAP